MEPGMECLGIVRIKIPQPIVPAIRMEVILFLRGFVAAAVFVLRISHRTEPEEVVCRHGGHAFLDRFGTFSLGRRLSNKLSNVLCGNIFKELFSCLRPYVPIMLAKNLAGSMLRRQVLFDEVVICSGFEHLDAFFDSLNQPPDKLGNLILESGRLSAFVLNDDIFVAEHDCPVSLVFELNSLQLIPPYFIREPCFPFLNEFLYRIEIAAGNFFLCVAVILDGPAFRAKPERPYSVLRDRSDLLDQFKELIKQFVALIIVDAAVHSKVIISAEPMNVLIHFGLS